VVVVVKEPQRHQQYPVEQEIHQQHHLPVEMAHHLLQDKVKTEELDNGQMLMILMVGVAVVVMPMAQTLHQVAVGLVVLVLPPQLQVHH
jgi:hypothetical protein